jgi:DNA-binding transcriptional LysR family regulator
VAFAPLIAPLISDYVAAYPAVSFDLIMTDHLVEPIEQRFDLALRPGRCRIRA